MEQIVSVVVPIVVGIVIGYVTNAIAIRMLFRPYKAYYIGKIRIPFTPGIIPKQRDRLAQSLGKTVGRELFAPEALKSHVEQPGFQAVLNRTIAGITGRVLGMSSPEVETVPESGEEPTIAADAHEDRFAEAMTTLLRAFVKSPRFLAACRAGIPRIAGFLDHLPLSGLIPSDARARVFMRGLFYTSNAEGSHRDRREFIRIRLIDPLLAWARKTGFTISSVLPPDWKSALKDSLVKIYPHIVGLVLSWLSSQPVRDEMRRQGQGILQRAISALSGIQRFLLSAGQYDRALYERMPEIIDDLVRSIHQTLEKEQIRNELIDKLLGAVERFSLNTITEHEQSLGIDVGEVLTGALYGIVNDGFERLPHLFGKLRDWASEDPRRTIGALWKEVTGSPIENLVRRLMYGFVRWAQKEETVPELISFFHSMIRNMSVAEQQGLDSAARQEGSDTSYPGPSPDSVFAETDKGLLDTYLAMQATAALIALLPKVVQAFDVQGMVVNRVNGLSTRELEKLIVGIVGREFTWINILGGFLGGLIGLVQVIIS